MSKLDIPYEKGAPNVFCMVEVGMVVEVIVETVPLSEVVGVWLEEILVGEGGGGGTTPPPSVTGMGV
jgi:hypothetical protein